MNNIFITLYEQLQTLTLFHVSNTKFTKFNPYFTAQGIIWFANNKQDLLTHLHGASISSSKPLYLYTCKVLPNKIANRDEYEKYSIGELKRDGFDIIELEGDFAVINPKIIKILNVQQIK